MIGGLGGQFIILREVYILNLRLLVCLEPFISCDLLIPKTNTASWCPEHGNYFRFSFGSLAWICIRSRYIGKKEQNLLPFAWKAELARVCRRSSQSSFGRPTGINVSGHFKQHYFVSFFFFSFVYFSHRRRARINFEKVDGSTKKPWGRPLSRPCQPFWDQLAAILDFLRSHRRNDRIKKLILQKLIRGYNNLRFNLFPDRVAYFGLSGR